MTVYNLLIELLKCEKNEIEFALGALMLANKLDYVHVSNAYVQALNVEKEDQLNQLVEAETCVAESFLYKKSNEKEDDSNHTQRCLYLLNKSNRFQMNSLNLQYNYDEEKGKQMSWYERNKATYGKEWKS